MEAVIRQVGPPDWLLLLVVVVVIVLVGWTEKKVIGCLLHIQQLQFEHKRNCSNIIAIQEASQGWRQDDENDAFPVDGGF